MKPKMNLLALPCLLCIVFTFTTTMGQAQQKPRATINHIAMTVNNLQTSALFYKNILGLDTIAEPFHDGLHAWFSLGPKTALHVIDKKLLPAGEPFIQTYSRGNHLCISIASVDEQIVVLKKNHLTWVDWAGTVYGITSRPDGVKQIWFQDPDGSWIEVNDAKE